MESSFEVPSKACTKCGVVKPLTEFSPRNNRNPLRASSLQSQCKACCAIAARRTWQAKASDPQFRAQRVRAQRWTYQARRKLQKCGDCGVRVEDGKVHCPICREKRRINELKRRELDRLHKVCSSCGEPNPYGNRLCSACSESKERRYTCQRRYEWSLRLKAFEAYGGALCSCCGESQVKFLTIDHIGGNGNTHRRSISRDGTAKSARIYTWLSQNNYPPGFQVLCYNCNCGSYRNGGICPHKQVNEDNRTSESQRAAIPAPIFSRRGKA
jgi:hypothetical protein